MIRETRETIGKIASPIGVITSYLMLPAYGVLFGPKDWAETVRVPVFNLDLYTFVQVWMPALFWTWAISNLLSKRWAPETLVKNDRFSSLVAFVGIVAIAGYNLVVGNVPLIETTLYGWFGIIPLAAFVDWWMAKGDKFRSSTLTDENKRLSDENKLLTDRVRQLEAELADTRARLMPFLQYSPAASTTAPGPLMSFVPLLGVTNLNPARVQLTGPEPVFLVLTADGCTALDIDLPEPRVREILTAEVGKRATKP